MLVSCRQGRAVRHLPAQSTCFFILPYNNAPQCLLVEGFKLSFLKVKLSMQDKVSGYTRWPVLSTGCCFRQLPEVAVGFSGFLKYFLRRHLAPTFCTLISFVSSSTWVRKLGSLLDYVKKRRPSSRIDFWSPQSAKCILRWNTITGSQTDICATKSHMALSRGVARYKLSTPIVILPPRIRFHQRSVTFQDGPVCHEYS